MKTSWLSTVVVTKDREGRMAAKRKTIRMSGIELLCAMLMADGSMCPKCGYGTRKTSKNWRRCKRETCGERLRLEPATKELIEGNARKFEEYVAARDAGITTVS